MQFINIQNENICTAIRVGDGIFGTERLPKNQTLMGIQ